MGFHEDFLKINVRNIHVNGIWLFQKNYFFNMYYQKVFTKFGSNRIKFRNLKNDGFSMQKISKIMVS